MLQTTPTKAPAFYCTHRDCLGRGRLLSLPWREDGGYPLCPSCGRVMREDVQAPAVVWTGAIGQRYRQKDLAGYHDPDGMTMYTRNTPDGKPKPVRLESWSEVRQFAKAEGLADPRSLPANLEVDESGKRLKNTMGLPGSEV